MVKEFGEQPDKLVESFQKLFALVRDTDLFADGPPHKLHLTDPKLLHQEISEAAGNLPGLYQDGYVNPLLRNIAPTMHRCSQATIETLAGAVCDHTHPDRQVKEAVKALLAVISNVYRSFLIPEFGNAKQLPKPRVTTPSLVMFRPKLYLENNPPEIAPFILPANEIERLCGGTIGVVCLPSNYRTQPALCWAALAHEVGGHDVLNAFDGLVWEIQHRVRHLFYKGKDPSGEEPESKEQFLGCLWQYWTEEAASDVCAIMNLGPAYAKGVAVYLAALNERIWRWKNGRNSGTSAPAEIPVLTTSWPPSDNRDGEPVNSHPTDLLKLHVMKGAVEGLRNLAPQHITRFLDDITRLIEYMVDPKDPLNKTIQIRGWIQFKPGRWVRIKDNAFPIERKEMEEHARAVGKLIATTSFETLNANSIQDLETWDTSDQLVAEECRDLMLAEKINYASGDDAQLIAGAIMALYEKPKKPFYETLNKGLFDSLRSSFDTDPVWVTETYHPIV